MININYTPAPGMTETHLFADFQKNEAREAGTVTVELYLRTKTRLSISLRHNSTSIGVNFIPPGSESLKFDADSSISYFSGIRSTKQYFKLSKKQSLPQLEQHLKNIITEVFSLTDQDYFEINVWMNRAYYAVKQASPALAS